MRTMQVAKELPKIMQPPRYRLFCNGCKWCIDAPMAYPLARAIVWAHQRKVSDGHEHAVVFIPQEA